LSRKISDWTFPDDIIAYFIELNFLRKVSFFSQGLPMVFKSYFLLKLALFNWLALTGDLALP
jgi:hypothetical protein